MLNRECIVLTGGGTGGHVFPMIAVADELSRLAPHVDLVFVGTERGIESQVVPERGYRLELLDVLPIRGGGIGGAVKGVRRALATLPEARRLLQSLSPSVVFSLGGYAAGPISLAARSMDVPVALMEPNSVVGLSNRLVARLVSRAYTCFPEVERHFSRSSVLRTGVAIRRGFEPRPYAYDGGTLNVLVLGGSQGAKSLNESVPDALAATRAPLRVVHQAGKGNDGAVRNRYAGLGANENVSVVPFISDMPSAIATADLVIGRSGAGAVSEICAVGRPSLLIPYPFASGDHQFKNATYLEQAHAAVCLRSEDASVARLTRELDRLAADPGLLTTMAGAARGLGRPEASEVVARDLLQLGNVSLTEYEADAFDDTALAGGSSTPAPSEVH